LKRILDQFLNALVAAAEDKKASEIMIYDVSEKSVVTDRILLASAANSVHCKAVMKALEDVIHKLRSRDYADFFYEPRISGSQDSGWIIVDLNSIVIHVVLEDVRHRYHLDKLFDGAKDTSIIYHN